VVRGGGNNSFEQICCVYDSFANEKVSLAVYKIVLEQSKYNRINMYVKKLYNVDTVECGINLSLQIDKTSGNLSFQE